MRMSAQLSHWDHQRHFEHWQGVAERHRAATPNGSLHLSLEEARKEDQASQHDDNDYDR
jgi:hypothetical protein